MHNDERVRLLFDNPEDAHYHGWAKDPAFFDRFLYYCLSVANSRPSEALEPVRAALWLAPTRCQAAKAWGLLTYIQRSRGNLAQAASALDGAFMVAGDCEECLADLCRRRAVVLREQSDFKGGLEAADEALRRYAALGHPGHDFHRNGLASSYNVRAGIHLHSNNASAAVLDEREAMVLIDPLVSPSLYGTVLANLAFALHSTGEHSDLLLADEYLKKARRQYQGVQTVSLERANLNWVTGMVRRRLKTMCPGEACKLLEGSLIAFLEIGMPVEAVAILSDISRIELARPGYREQIGNLLSRITGRLPLKTLKPEIQNGLARLETDIDKSGWYGRDKVKAVIEQLREACGPDMMACLLT